MLDRVLINWPLKLLAVSLAFAIWVFVSGEKRIGQDFEVPLDVQVPVHLALLEAPQATVSVRLRGPESLIRRVRPVGMELGVELTDLPPGEYLNALIAFNAAVVGTNQRRPQGRLVERRQRRGPLH